MTGPTAGCAVKERPILFSAPMVRAILEGRKSQTRRVVTQKGPDFHSRAQFRFLRDGVAVFGDSIPDDPVPLGVRCPYGQPGDRLWVREAWCPDPPADGTWAHTQWTGCKGSLVSEIPERFHAPDHCLYRATWDGPELRWRPSIHMPRWASRITLELTEVRVQRVQDISEKDAKAEGVIPEEQRCFSARGGFNILWDSINKKRGFGWNVNPWVWALTFKRIPQEQP